MALSEVAEEKETCKDCKNIYCTLYKTDFEACARKHTYDKKLVN